MTPQELKASILQLAIQGKLVEHLANEHPVDANTTFCGDTSDFFEIPETWKWLSIKDVASVNTGLSFKKQDQRDFSNGSLRILRGGNIGDDYEYHLYEDDVYVDLDQFRSKYIQLIEGDIITPSVTSIEKICKTGFINRDLSAVTAGGFVYIIRCLDRSVIEPKYLLYFISSFFNKEQCKPNIHKSGQAFYNLKKSGFVEQPICIPPLAEQKRIVAKIEELLPLIDRYEKAWSELKEFNKRFPVDMQKSILQTAIQGKLVPQFPEEEGTGEELYQQIQKEKQRLIKEGKNKKEKPLPEITEDEIPFDIPESWHWGRLEDVVIKPIKRGKSPTYSAKSNTLVFAQKCNTKAGLIDLSLSLYLDETKLSKYPCEEFMKDCDIVINSTGNGTLGRVGIYHNSDNPTNLQLVPDSHVTVIRAIETMSIEYVYYVLKYYQPIMEKLGTGSTNQTELSAGVVRALLFPIPPLAEQKRIVAKLEEILPLCERLK